MSSEPAQIGPYEVEAEIGRGGMGVVWRATDPRLGRSVAIKGLPDHLANDPERLARFEREARVLAGVTHPNIAQLFGVEEADGTRYLVLEHVEGQTLQERLNDGPLPVDEAIELCAQIASGVEAAHAAGIVHRDLKPGNIKIAPDGTPKVLDFGLAKSSEGSRVSGADSAAQTLSVPTTPDAATAPGVVLGTAPYMSPEQARGRAMDKRTDIWSFGVVLYECLTGISLFAGETTTDSLGAILHREIDWNRLPTDTPPTVRLLLRRCLTRDRKRRLQDMGDARIELQEAHDDPSTSVLIAAERALPHEHRKSVVPLALLGAVLLVVGAGIGWLIAGFSRDVPSPETVRFTLDLPEGMTVSGINRDGAELAISPDGRTIAVLAETGAEDEPVLYIRDLGTGETRPLTGYKNPRNPCFSPDGRWLAFVEDYKLLRRVPVAGGPARTIAEGVRPTSMTWLESGHIVYREIITNRIKRISADGGTPEPLLEPNDTLLGLENVASVPGHPELAIVVAWTGQTIEDYALLVVDAETGEWKKVTNGAQAYATRDGHLLYLRGSTVMIAPWDPTRGELTGEERVLIDGVSASQWVGTAQYAVAANGTVAYVPGKRAGSGRRLVWIDQESNTEPLVEEEGAYTNRVELSPDGRRALFGTLERNECLWSVELATGRRTLVYDDTETWWRAWLNDSERVLISAPTPDGVELSLVSADGNSLQSLATSSNIGGIALTPDDKWVYCERRVGDDNPKYEIWRFPFADPEKLEVVVTSEPGRGAWSPRVSRDGRWLLYASARTGTTEIYLRGIDSRSDVRLSGSGGDYPVWSPDGNWVYFSNGATVYRLSFAATGDSPSIGDPEVYCRDPSLEIFGGFDVGVDGRIARIQPAPWELEPRHIRVATHLARSPEEQE